MLPFIVMFLIAFPQTTVRSVPLNPADSVSKSSPPVMTPLAFQEFFEVGSRELKPSAKLLSLNGKRVRIVGFMAQMEEPIKGGFYLCPRPIFCDEGGGGTADLPPETILVVLRSAKGKGLAHRPQALEATGILQVGAETDENGHVSMLRLILDRPQDRSRSSAKVKPGMSPSTGKKHHAKLK